MDPTSFAASAHVKAFVVPLGPITVGQFQQHFDRLRKAAEVPLIDVHLPVPAEKANGSLNTGMNSSTLKVQGTAAQSTNTTFDPRANPTGHLKYSFETSPVTEPHMSLVDLEPWRQQFLTIGIAHAGSNITLEGLSRSLKEMRKMYSKSIYHAVLLFDASPEAEDLKSFDGVVGVNIFPIDNNNITALESTLSTLSGHFLSRLSNFWTVRQLSSFQSPSALLKSGADSAKTRSGTDHQGAHRQNNNNMGPHHHYHEHSPSAVTLGRHGSISMTSAERAKARQDGRTRKFLGNLYLLSGRISDALTELGMAATVLKEHDDHLWLGSALNDIGLCLVIQKFEKGLHGIPSTAVAAAWAVASQQLKKTKVSRASVPPTVLHTTSTVTATANTSAATSTATTATTATTTTTMSPAQGGATVAAAHAGANALGSAHSTPQSDRRDSQSSVSTSSIDGSAQNSAGSAAPNTTGSPRSSATLTRIASLRKSKPFTDQTPVEEILEFIVMAALQEYAFGEGMEIVPYTVYYESIVRYANFLISLRFGQGWTDRALASALRQEAPPLDNSAPAEYPTILEIERWISKVYEISLSQLEPDIQALILGSVARLYARAGLKRKWAFTCAQIVSILASSRATVHTDLGQVAEVLQVYSTWPKLEAQMLRKLIPLGQRIQNAKLQTDAASQLLALVCRDDYPMVDKDQMTLYHLISSYSDVTQANFWDPDLVESASIKAQRLQSARSTGLTSSPRGSTGNALAQPQSQRTPRGSVSSTRPLSTMSTGPFIYNPYDAVDTNEKGSIETGIPTTARICLRNPLAIDIQVFELALVDKEGKFISEVIKNVTLPPSTTQFRVEVTVMPPADTSTLIVSGCYVQVSGCSSRIYDIPEIKVPVIPARPVLVLQKLSLLKGWTMLLEGERKRFNMTLWNSSKIDNEILHFGFNDSPVDLMRTAAGRPDLARADLYEYEYFLHKRRSIDLVDGDKIEESAHIGAQNSRTFEFELTGKRGVNSAAVLVDYGLSEDTLRRLKIPLQVTIYPSINVDRANILPSNKKNTVLVIIDLRNLWRESLSCKLWADNSEPVEQWIDSSNTRRFVLEVPWEPSSPEELLRPIPSMSNRQYTVDTRTSPEQLQLFWLREKLLKKLHGEWSNTQARCGFIELRMIQLSKRMAETLKISPIEITATLSKPSPMVDESVSMVVSAVNHSSHPVQGVLRLIANKPAQRYMLVLGCQQQLVTMAAGERVEAIFEMIFLNKGTVELSSVLDPIDHVGSFEPVFQTEKTVVHI